MFSLKNKIEKAFGFNDSDEDIFLFYYLQNMNMSNIRMNEIKNYDI